MKCVNCGLINPETAIRCDCGYDFATQTVMASHIPGYKRPLHTPGLPAFFYTVIVFVGVGPLAGFFAVFFLQAVLTGGISSLSASDNRYIALLPFAYWLGAIPALGTGILYGLLQLILPPGVTKAWFWRAALCGAIGTAVTAVYCQWTGLGSALIWWAGLPAGVICGLIARNILTEKTYD